MKPLAEIFPTFLPKVAPTERVRFWHAVVGLSCVASAGILARTLGNTLFLAYYPVEALAYVYLGTAIVLIIAAFVYRRLVNVVSHDRLIVGTCMVIAFLCAVVRVGLLLPGGGFRVAAYFLADLIAKLLFALFWGFAAVIFNPREGKRLLALVGASGTLAVIVTGATVPWLTRLFGMQNLIVVVAVLVGAFGLTIRRLLKREPGLRKSLLPQRKWGRDAVAAAHFGMLFKAPLVRNLCLLVVVSTIALFLVDYTFMGTVRGLYPRSEELAGFLGQFYAGASFVALGVQLLLVRFILQRAGVLVALLILPTCLLACVLGSVLTGAVGFAIAAKFMEPALFFSIDWAAVQMLYQGIRKQTRGQSQALVEGLFKPLAVSATGLALIFARDHASARYLAAIVAAACVLWIILAFVNSRSYVAGLVASLGSRRLDLSEAQANFCDKTFENHMRRTLVSAPDADVPYLLAVLPDVEETNWAEEHRRLLERDPPDIKVAALSYLGRHGTPDDFDLLLSYFDHEAPSVRAAAIGAAASVGGHSASEHVEKCLQDASPEVRGVAAAELINVGDFDGLLSGCVALREMLNSEAQDLRIAAANALAQVRHAGLTRSLSVLLANREAPVCLAALNAFRESPNPDLVPLVVPLLSEPKVASAAADALVAVGSPVLEHLAQVVDVSTPEGAPSGAYRVPGIMASVGGEEALARLETVIHSPDLQLRHEATVAIARLMNHLPKSARSKFDGVRHALTEATAARDKRELMEALLDREGCAFVVAALEEEYATHLQNALLLIGTRELTIDMKAVHHGVTTGSRDQRARAVEILDNVLEGELKTELLHLLEKPPAASDARPTADVLHGFLTDASRSEWIVAGAAYAVAELARKEHLGDCERLLDHPGAHVRETALHAVGRLAGREGVLAACARLADDESVEVRRLAEELRANP